VEKPTPENAGKIALFRIATLNGVRLRNLPGAIDTTSY
jgi:hypothetical protein